MRLITLLVVGLLAACGQDMARQPKLRAQAPSSLWADGGAARPQVTGTVARGALTTAATLAEPPPMSASVVARGRERYDIFCAPCHGLTGAGDGRVVQRGFPAPPSFLSGPLRRAPARHFVDVITHGYGVMFSYASRVPPDDRWAIVAYVRALQRAAPVSAASAPP
ncbi:MAG: cytochrome c [Burkholderiaceae bacterium]